MSVHLILFLAFGAVAIAGAVNLLAQTHPINSALSLIAVMAALAGFILAARFGSTRPDIGTGLELTVITVTVLGGVSIAGGAPASDGADVA